MQANPATIFVYREEPSAVLQVLGKSSAGASTTPVVYQLNLHDPRGFFLANNFTMRDRDVIYYAPAGSTGLMKFMGLINTFIAPAVSGLGVAGSAATLGAF
jgi:polysaccharide export outer membrane protein